MDQALQQRVTSFLNWITSDVNDSSKYAEMTHLKEALVASSKSYTIASITVEDMLAIGLLPDPATDMDRLASKLGDDYCNQLFRESLYIIASEGFGAVSLETAVGILINLANDIASNPDEDLRSPEMLRAAITYFMFLDYSDRVNWDGNQFLHHLSSVQLELGGYSDLGTSATYKELIDKLTLYANYANSNRL